MKRKLAPLAALAVAFGGLALAACNTVSGVGRDLQAAGRAMTNVAEDAKRDEATPRPAPRSQSAGRTSSASTPSGPR